MYTIYAFCKEIDNAVDEPPAGSNPQEELRRLNQSSRVNVMCSFLPKIIFTRVVETVGWRDNVSMLIELIDWVFYWIREGGLRC